ncbi:hypothetical protein BDB00DRAFT_801408 [Zychaea mexicana]|uniref:uncharacterized protein n=1 Tax=Zychaea mexicana TaxID=64656 RepID=UPI0022FE6891|nr:uncharacterized protein BDB00DRAFT_801408 [Zychaea mexicana]KAI9498167.1 hypothetical protein BDB00DRAFT_801408 [Zychaea mexicana]
MNSPLQQTSQPPFTGYGFESGRFFSQQSTPPDEPFDDENQLPTPAEFDAIVNNYLNNLSPKKRDKALVDQQRYQLIQQVLKDPRNTAISTAQFRFWVKKMFQLQPGTIDLVCHDSKPVAMKEQIYSILVRAHREAHHGGRDKTSALVKLLGPSSLVFEIYTNTRISFTATAIKQVINEIVNLVSIYFYHCLLLGEAKVLLDTQRTRCQICATLSFLHNSS